MQTEGAYFEEDKSVIKVSLLLLFHSISPDTL